VAVASIITCCIGDDSADSGDSAISVTDTDTILIVINIRCFNESSVRQGVIFRENSRNIGNHTRYFP